MKYTVDTNVPIIANGHSDPDSEQFATIECQLASVQFLRRALTAGKIVLDLEGEVIAEYRRYLRPSGQPGVGDQFYLAVINSHPDRIIRVALEKRLDGQFADCPQRLIDSNFDPSDRKFAAIACNASAVVVNATDSDWVNHRDVISECGITVDNICGCDTAQWFVA